MAIATNPIQQRMEYLADQWNDIPLDKKTLICTHIHENDVEILDAFYWYMLGIDSPISDIAILLESDFYSSDSFSEFLIKELEGIVHIWNEAKFEDGLEKKNIEWIPNYSYPKDDWGSLFLDNIYSLLDFLQLDDNVYLVVNIRASQFDKKEMRTWLSRILNQNISKKLKILVTEFSCDPYIEKLEDTYSNDIHVWKPNIDSSNTITQVASMGDPLDPGTEYRSTFSRLTKAISENDYKKAVKDGDKCIEIATKSIDTDPYWIAQIVTVSIILSIEAEKNKKEKDTFERANDAIAIGATLPEILGKQIGSPIYAQALINKATLLTFHKKWKDAHLYYIEAAEYFEAGHVYVTALESYRMAGYCATKKRDSDLAVEALCNGFEVGYKIDIESIRTSTFALLIIHLLKLDYEEQISDEKINLRATEVYGEDWEDLIKKYEREVFLEDIENNNPFLPDEEENNF